MMYASERQARQLDQQRQQVEQLRREAAVKRICVSQALADIQRYVMDKQSEDYLLIGFANNKQNPYREKSSCELL